MGSLVKYTLILSVVIALVSFWNRNNFPDDINYIAGLNDEPKQNPIKQDAFSVSYENVNYIVEPQYDYELYGLVVSYRHHDGDSMLHKLWNDHLNAADVCVLWGNTAKSHLLNKLTFWNGQFTCNVKTRDREAWANFNMTELANNHLLTSDDYLRDKISSLKVGDQIYIKGRLASYGAAGGSKRGTSTTRTDTGNGACETIFVDDFQIVDRPSNIWRSSLTLSSLVFVLTLLFYFFSPYRPHR